MKNQKIKLITLLAVALLLNLSCSKDNDSVSPEPNKVFELSISPETYEANFFESGETNTFNLNTNIGEASEISILESPNYLFIESGKLNWTRELPVGRTTAFVRAYNEPNNQESITQITFTNMLRGFFLGSIYISVTGDAGDTTDVPLVFDFNNDGSFTYYANSGEQSSTYEITENNHIVFSIELDETLISFNGLLQYIDQEPILAGGYYLGPINPDDTMDGAAFEFMFEF